MAKETLILGFMIKEVFEKEMFSLKNCCDSKAAFDTLRNASSGLMTKHMSTKHFPLQEWCVECLQKKKTQRITWQFCAVCVEDFEVTGSVVKECMKKERVRKEEHSTSVLGNEKLGHGR